MFGHRLTGYRQTQPVASNPVSKRNKEESRPEMSIEKDVVVIPDPKKELSYYHPQAKIGASLTGSMSSQTYLYTISTVGDEINNKLFTLDLSGLAPGSQTLLTVLGFKTFLLNYAATEFPASYYLTSPSINGMYGESGEQTNIVSSTHVTGGISSITNAGGIVGFNMTYDGGQAYKSWDITGLTTIDFTLLVGTTQAAPIYPLNNEMSIEIMITRVQ